MGSGYFGEPNMGNHHHHHHERGGKKGSSKKGKKNSSSSSEKPKQPQRGLGVAQLEKIRLTGQLGCTTNINNSFHGDQAHWSIPSSSFPYSPTSHPSYGYNNPNCIMMGVGDYERTNNHIRYGDSQPSSVPSWHLGSSMYESDHQHDSLQNCATRHLFNLHETTSWSKKHRSDSIGSSSQNSAESSDNQELDLELRLSL